MVGRYAPSPTGDLHLGNLRTALLAWMFARRTGSEFIVRMEDLDSSRVRPGAADRQLEDLSALGLNWDAPVSFQSERARLYETALNHLPTYECFCTRAEIRAAVAAPHGALPEGAYPGTCLELTEAERDRLRPERPPALRVRADGARMEVQDALLGTIEGVVDDFVLRRNDGAFAYNLAVVCDDAQQGVEQVVRGADLADCAPRQAWLAQQLGAPILAYAHVPLVLGPDGSRLAKRHGDVTLRDVTPEDARAWMANSLGMEGARTAAELLERFDPATLPREPTIWSGNLDDPADSQSSCWQQES